MVYYGYFVKVQYVLFFWGVENSKLVHNRSVLLSLKTCYLVITFVEYFKVALHVQTAIVTIGYVIMSIVPNSVLI